MEMGAMTARVGSGTYPSVAVLGPEVSPAPGEDEGHKRMGLHPSEAYIFDLDGTLVDSRVPMVRALNETLETFGRPSLDEDLLAHQIGTPSGRILGELGGVKARDLGEAVALSRRLYLEYQLLRVELFPGVREGLLRLGHRRRALVTIRIRATAEAVLEAADLLDLFSMIVGWEEVRRPKPDPEGIVRALRSFGVAPAGAATIGDRALDVLAARAAGTFAVAVSYGYAAPGELEAARPDLIIGDLRDLPI